MDAEKEQKSCAGFRVSGYWKGYPCGAVAKYELNGKWYCANHLVVAQMDAEDMKRILKRVRAK